MTALVLLWSAAVLTAALANVAMRNLAAAEVPDNRGGAASVTAAFRFAGIAAAPLVLVPLFPTTAFAVA